MTQHDPSPFENVPSDDAPTTLSLPVVPLRELVLFPGITMPIAVGRPGTLKAIEAAKSGEKAWVFAVTQRENLTDVEADNQISCIAGHACSPTGCAGLITVACSPRYAVRMVEG